MEWYWILAIIVSFFAIAGVFAWLGKKGFLYSPQMKVITNIVNGLASIVGMLAEAADNVVIDTADQVMQLITRAVLAAENAYYNAEISAEERKDYCLNEFDKLLAAFHIELTEAQRNILDTLIRAACEEMGHSGL